jgi:hypothetical protein
MEKRYYQPSLLWSLARDWYTSQPDNVPIAGTHGPNDLTLYVYRTDTTGAYMLNGPKLYWQPEPMSGSHFSAIDQDDIAEHADSIGEVVMWDRRMRKTVVIGTNYETAISVMRGGRVGRPSLGAPGEKSVMVQFRLPESLAAKLGDDRNDYAREIVIEYINREK